MFDYLVWGWDNYGGIHLYKETRMGGHRALCRGSIVEVIPQGHETRSRGLDRLGKAERLSLQ